MSFPDLEQRMQVSDPRSSSSFSPAVSLEHHRSFHVEHSCLTFSNSSCGEGPLHIYDDSGLSQHKP